MSENTAKSPNGGSRKEIAKEEVSQEEIDRHIAAFTGNPQTTIVVCSIDTAFLKESKPVKEDSSERGHSYVDFGEEGKSSLQELEQNKGLIISTHKTTTKAKAKARKEKEEVKDKKEESREEDREN